MREQGQTSTRESAQDILLGCLRLWKPAIVQNYAIRREKDKSTNPKQLVSSQLSPFTAGNSRAKARRMGSGLRFFALGRPAISSREEVVSGWRRQPSRRIRARVRRNGGEAARGRAGARLQDGRACRSPCVAPNRIADKWRPTFPCKCLDVFSQGSKLPRWRCCGRLL